MSKIKIILLLFMILFPVLMFTLQTTVSVSSTITISVASGGGGGGTSQNMTPLTDLGSGFYQPGLNSSGQPLTSSPKYKGGLYPNGTNSLTDGSCGTGCTAHDTDGKQLATNIHAGQSSSNPVGFLIIGYSDARLWSTQFCSDFVAQVGVANPNVKCIVGAQSGLAMCPWTSATGGSLCNDPGAPPNNGYGGAESQIMAAGLTDSQIQAIVIDVTDARPQASNSTTDPSSLSPPGIVHNSSLPCTGASAPASTYFNFGSVTGNGPATLCASDSDYDNVKYRLGQIIRAAKTRYTNLKQAFFVGRAYGGYATNGFPASPGATCPSGSWGNCAPNPSRYDYETSFAMRDAVIAQINQCPSAVVGTSGSCSSSGTDSLLGNLRYDNGTAPWLGWLTYLWANGATPNANGLSWVRGDFDSSGSDFVSGGQEKAASCNGDGLHPWGVCYNVLNSSYTKPYMHF